MGTVGLTTEEVRNDGQMTGGREPAVKRIRMGDNQGITELVLREF